MKLDFNKIKEITAGAARVAECESGVTFFRFTDKEEEYYFKSSPNGFYKKTFSTAGVRMSFKTDSKKLCLSVSTFASSSRSYFGIDVSVNGKVIGGIYNHEDKEMVGNYTPVECPLGTFSKEFELGDGKKDVIIYLPWSVAITLHELSLDDGAICESIKRDKLLIAYGDSITHGYDALYPSNRYISKLSDALGAEEINKAIGGDVFQPELAECAADLTPDYVTVAYGTNDWGKRDKDSYFENCRDFYTIISKKYPNAKIFAITPIWRKDCDEERRGGRFFELEPRIAKAIEGLPNVTIIPGIDLVPKDELMYADLRLHPNDEGFEHYFKNLLAEIKNYLV